MKKIVILNTVDEVIGALDGPVKLSKKLGISRPAIYKWRTSGIPERQGLRILFALNQRGFTVPAKLLNMVGISGCLITSIYHGGHESDVNRTHFQQNHENDELELDLFQQAAE